MSGQPTPPPTITDSAGNVFTLVAFFDYDSRQYLYALKLVKPGPGGEELELAS